MSSIPCQGRTPTRTNASTYTTHRGEAREGETLAKQPKMQKTFAPALKLYWYPGHMVKGMRVIKDKLRDIDLVVEVRDARIPTSSANPHFDALIKEKSRIIVFNKSDLAEAHFEQVGTRAIALLIR